MHAFRDPSYPFRPGDWDFGSFPEIEITRADSVRLRPGQSTEIRASVKGPGRLGLRYLLVDPSTRSVVTTGEARPGTGEGEFVVSLPAELTTKLFPGLYQMSLVAYSDSIAFVVDRTVDIDVES
jgi:peptide/nickel transport system substrate-binding protein